MARNTASKRSSSSFSVMIDADPRVEHELHAQALDQLDLAAQHRLGQAIFRQRKAQHAAGFGQRIEHRDIVSQQRQIERGRQSGWARRRRWRSCGRCAPACAWQCAATAASKRSDSRTLSAMKRCTSRMFTASSIVWRRQRLSQGCWHTRPVEHGSGLSRMTDSNASSSRLFLVELQEARNVHVQRTTVFARRQRQFRAHARLAALRHDVVFELLAEVPHGGQHRIRRRLSQPAQRAVADVAAQLVQRLHVLHAARARR